MPIDRHTPCTSYGDQLIGNCYIFLNAVNVEAQHGVSEDRLFTVLFGGSVGEVRYDDIRQRAVLYLLGLRPLYWNGLFSEVRIGLRFNKQEHFFKTPLWHVAPTLDTDTHREMATPH